MTKLKFLLLLKLILVAFSCQQEKSKLDHAKEFAGNNRIELEKVLKHYANDSLKYKAACFLIENMPYYYSYKHERINQYQKEYYQLVENNQSYDKAIEILRQKYGVLNPNEYEVVYDAHIITANYLINNIDWAFKVWEEKPWNRNLSFEEFCETILPYRISTEPLEYWREHYYVTYQPILDSLLINSNDPKEAIEVLWESIHAKQWLYNEQKPFGYPFPGAVTLDTVHRIGDCYEFNNFAIYLMRALGIPGGTDAYLKYPYDDDRHLWNYVPDADGNLWIFSINGYLPELGSGKEFPMMGSVFRTCFGVQENSLPIITNGRKDLPPLLNTVFKKDVSHLYLHNASIEIEIEKENLKDSLLYLCTFSRNGWTPIRWSVWKAGKFIFPTVEKNTLYVPAYYINGKLFFVQGAGKVNDDGVFVSFIADTINTQTLSAKRKYPYKKSWFSYRKRIIGGKFQVSNDSTFRNAITLHTINKETEMRWYNVKLNTSGKYRYIRYLSGPRGHCNMAELEFFDKEGKKLHGKIIGTEGSYQGRNDNQKEAVFDRDPLTFFDAINAKESWAGLDLSEPKEIKEVNYLFRNDDNNIRLGDVYELFYFGEKGWNVFVNKYICIGIFFP
ncbi:hypothetical protein [Bacteroides sp. 519]|uniref:hypothetical protein n=1 Tax=Bacteroides sp. 519 TaxID=2302937 RepID=UPI0013D8D078|nr:hypothetical protein [Bacteroides sp. 519]NDV58507.1 hypothetical protein [Bacteroides sp. 519]